MSDVTRRLGDLRRYPAMVAFSDWSSRILKILKLLLVSILIVGAGLLGFLTFEQHSEILSDLNELQSNRDQIIAGRGGEVLYDWYYLYDIRIPRRWVTLKWFATAAMLLLAVGMMLYRGEMRENPCQVGTEREPG